MADKTTGARTGRPVTPGHICNSESIAAALYDVGHALHNAHSLIDEVTGAAYSMPHGMALGGTILDMQRQITKLHKHIGILADDLYRRASDEIRNDDDATASIAEAEADMIAGEIKPVDEPPADYVEPF